MQNNSNQAVKATSQMSNAELLARISELEAKVAAKGTRDLTFHISEKTGAIVIRGWGKFPLTMYGGQFDRLDAKFNELKAFREKYSANLAVKDADYDAAKSLAGVPESLIIRVKEDKAAS
jgi:hypothetical protein